jgi:cytochrome P450
MTTVHATFDPLSQEFRANPYPAYAQLRRDAPVAQAAAFGVWTITRYDDVAQVLKSPQIFSSSVMGGAGMMGTPVRSIISSDPPQHTGMRNLVNRAFTPRMVAAMEPRIREIAAALLDDARARGGEMDIVRDLAVPLPVIVIAEILGVDPERREDFKRWSNAAVTTIGSDDPAERGRMTTDREEFLAYFREKIDERRKAPKDDLISALVAAEEGDMRLTPDEVASFAMLLLLAGNETTTNLIGNAILALLEHPQQLDAVRQDAALISNMVEEALRWDSPVQFLFRVTTQEAEVGGVTIPAGNVVSPVFASANRDDAHYPDGERFDITRNTQGHLAFGLGPHFCLGAPLARLEARVAFEELFARFAHFERADKSIDRIDSMFLRGLRSLPVRVSA